MYLEIMVLIALILLVITIVLEVFLLVKNKPMNTLSKFDLDDIKKVVNDTTNEKLENQTRLLKESNNLLFRSLEIKFDNLEKITNKTHQEVNEKLDYLYKFNYEFFNKFQKDNNEEYEKIKEKLTKELKEFTLTTKEELNKINLTLEKELKEIREDNTKKLDKINESVNEKLEKTLEGKLKQSFDNVIEQIGGVNKAIGEIKGLANDVGSLKTVLTNVKTKGIVGEVILGNIISDILTVGQYEENCITKDKSKDRVEFAIKMPSDDNSFIYLPIDSKLPLESYHKIKEAMDNGNPELIKEGRSELRLAIRKYAKDVSTKYIDVPNTTDFAIMFLPIEGLYIEALNMGLFEEIQREFKVNLAGPTTLTAILNSLQMGFKTLAIQKKSSDVFKLLGAVKTEFNKFADTLQKAQKKVDDASNELDSLVGTRTRMIQSKLRNIEYLDEEESKELLEIN
jgi:DNA recombination protein RmuC